MSVVLTALAEFDSMTWGELQQQQRPRAKCIEASELPEPARQRLLTLRRDDIDVLWELHLTGRRRLWGTREGAIFSVLWWDPEHQVYPSHLRRT
jgi:hypothetical protein